MANTDATLSIGADDSKLVATMNHATEEVRRGIEQMQAAFEGLTATFGRLNTMMMGVTAALAGGEIFKELIGDSMATTGQVMKLSKVFGMSTEQASELNVALKLTGQSAEDFSGMAFKLLKHVEGNAKGMEELGLKVRDAHGNLRPMMDLMKDAAALLKDYKEGADRDAAALYLFGKSAQEALGILKLNDQVMSRAKQIAHDYGLVVGEENAAAAKQFKQEQAAVGIVMEAVRDKVAEAAMPAFTGLAAWFSDAGPTAINVFTFALKHLIQFMEETVVAIRQAWSEIEEIWQKGVARVEGMYHVIGAALTGDIEGMERAKRNAVKAVEEIDRQHAEERVRIEADAAARVAKLWAESTGEGAAEGGGAGKGTKTWHSPDKSGADKSRMAAWEAQLADAKVYFEKTYDLREYSKAQELEYWRSILRNVALTEEEKVAVTRKAAEIELEVLKKARDQRIALNTEAIAAHEKAALDGVAADEEAAKAAADLGKLSKLQLLEEQEKFEDRRYDIQTTAQQARIEALKGDPNADPVALQKLLDEMAEIQRKHALDVQKIHADLSKETQAEWEKMFQPITSAIEKSITGMIMGTQTLKKSLSNLFQSILAEFVSLESKKIATWIAGELTQTAATKAGAQARTAAASEGQAASMAVQAKQILASIGNYAAEAFAAVTAFLAPIMGPAAPAGAAVVSGIVLAEAAHVVSSAAGGYDIPAGVNPLTQLHEREMVLPAQYADVIRGMAGSGGGGDTHHHHWNVNTIDARSFRDWLKHNASALPPALQQVGRNFMMSGR